MTVKMLSLSDRQSILNTLLTNMAIFGSLVMLFAFWVTFNQTRTWGVFAFWLICLFIIVLVTYWRNWPYALRGTCLLAVVYALGVQDIIFASLVGNGYLTLVLLPLLTMILFGRQTSLVSLLISVTTLWGTIALGNLIPPFEEVISFYTVGLGWLVTAAYFGFVGFVAFKLLRQYLASAQTIIDAEHQLVIELKKESQTIEQRMQARVHALKTSMQISRQITDTLDQRLLMRDVVEQICDAFGYSQVQLFILEGQILHLRAATGETGHRMLDDGYNIDFGQGIVGKVAREGHAYISPDVTQDSHWSPNPYLPDTKAEAAVPIRLENQVYAILDVHHDTVKGLDENDVYVLRVIADQIAVALQSAYLYERMQDLLAHKQIINDIRHRIQQATTMEDILKTAAEALGEAFGANNTRVAIGHENQLLSGEGL